MSTRTNKSIKSNREHVAEEPARLHELYQLFKVNSPEALMLQVIFNVVRSMAYEQMKHDPDLKAMLENQRQIFQLAAMHTGSVSKIYASVKELTKELQYQ